MIEEQPKRRRRIPLSREELYYFIQLKKLKQVEQIEQFRKSTFYKVFNFINIVLSACLAYYIFSVLFACQWQTENIQSVSLSRRGGFDSETRTHSITQVDIETNQAKFSVVTKAFYIEPLVGETILIGTDFIFNKRVKTKFNFEDRSFWNSNTYPSFAVCCFALSVGLIIYKINKHLSANGLLMVFGLYFLACLYFICI